MPILHYDGIPKPPPPRTKKGDLLQGVKVYLWLLAVTLLAIVACTACWFLADIAGIIPQWMM